MSEMGKSSFETDAKQLVISSFIWEVLFAFFLSISFIPHFLSSALDFAIFNMKNLYFVRHILNVNYLSKYL